jgi:hypothetical protein
LNLTSFLIFEPFYGWEIGIPSKAQINESIAERLWGDPGNNEPYSFTDYKGISLWIKARHSTDYYNLLMNTFELTADQMDQILDWLIRIREDYVVPSFQIQAGLPTDHYTFANTLFLEFLVAGVVIIGIGVMGIVTLLIIKRR